MLSLVLRLFRIFSIITLTLLSFTGLSKTFDLSKGAMLFL